MASPRFWLLSTAATVLLAATIPAHADVKAGEDAWNRADYAAAVQQWEGPAAQGDPDAQFHLAQAYRLGRGVGRDLAKAELLFGKAAAQGHLEAADFYGLMMFDRGDRATAMPYIRAASDRGDPRAQYLMGIAEFNGDLAPKDWVHAYALMTLAQSAGLPQAGAAIAQMDQHIPLAQRQAAAGLAAKLGEQAEANRRSQLAAADLGGRAIVPPMAAAPTGGVVAVAPPSPVPPPAPVATAPAVVAPITPAPTKPAATKPSPKPAPARTAPVAAQGPWRVQLGAFGVAANADAMWNRVKGRPEIAGHSRINAKAGAVIKLQAGGYASREAANKACAALTSAGLACLPVQD